MIYTHGHHGAVLRSHRSRTAQNSAAYLLGRLRPGLSLLDVGCGPGTITADLAALVAPGRVVAIDTSAEALAGARAVAAERGLSLVGVGPRQGVGIGTVDYVAGDVLALDFPDHTFDVVHAHQVLQHLGDPVAALREMRRVCAPDGVVAARDVDYAAMTWYPDNPGLDEWLTLYRRVARRNGGEPDAGRRTLSWARRAGFSEITCTASTWCYATPEQRAFWSGMWAERIVESDIADHAIRYGYATRGYLSTLADAWREWGASDDGWFAITHGEILCTP